jgi:hypothetical protein
MVFAALPLSGSLNDYQFSTGTKRGRLGRFGGNRREHITAFVAAPSRENRWFKLRAGAKWNFKTTGPRVGLRRVHLDFDRRNLQAWLLAAGPKSNVGARPQRSV